MELGTVTKSISTSLLPKADCCGLKGFLFNSVCLDSQVVTDLASGNTFKPVFVSFDVLSGITKKSQTYLAITMFQI